MTVVLVTGGTGFIGSHTSLVLLQIGYEIIIVDSLKNSSKNVINNINNIRNKNNKVHFFEGDLRDKHFLKKVFAMSNDMGKRIEAVIHFAGYKAVGESVLKPLKYWNNNVFGTINLLEIMTEFNCKTLIFSSSATVYGFSENSKISEDLKIEPINPYGNTKHAIEKLLEDCYLSETDKWKIISLRYFNPIGAHKSGKIGENPKGITNNIFPLINKVASGDLSYLNVFGKDWNTYDGTCVRDYIHVMDLAEGHVKALEYLLDSENSSIQYLNLGTGKGTSVLDLIDIFKRVNNVNIPFVFTERRKGDVGTVIAENNKAKKLLNWLPSRDIEQMCIDGWLWHCNNKKQT